MIDEIAKLAQLVIDLKSKSNVIAFNIHGDKFCVMLACGWKQFRQYPAIDEYAKITKENLASANNWLGREYESDGAVR